MYINKVFEYFLLYDYRLGWKWGLQVFLSGIEF